MNEPVNCPSCGRFMGWDSKKEEYTCSCGDYENIKDPNRPGWITLVRKYDYGVRHHLRKRGIS